MKELEINLGDFFHTKGRGDLIHAFKSSGVRVINLEGESRGSCLPPLEAAHVERALGWSRRLIYVRERERSSEGRFLARPPCVSVPQPGGPQVGPSVPGLKSQGCHLPPSLSQRRNPCGWPRFATGGPSRLHPFIPAPQPRPVAGSCAGAGCWRPDSPSDG